MKDIINNQLEYPKTNDFGAKSGGFNVLNVPDELYQSPEQFWKEYNQPWLDQAIQRDDVFSIATDPSNEKLLVNPTTGQLTGFGHEIQYLQQNGYVYDAVIGQMVKQ